MSGSCVRRPDFLSTDDESHLIRPIVTSLLWAFMIVVEAIAARGLSVKWDDNAT